LGFCAVGSKEDSLTSREIYVPHLSFAHLSIWISVLVIFSLGQSYEIRMQRNGCADGGLRGGQLYRVCDLLFVVFNCHSWFNKCYLLLTIWATRIFWVEFILRIFLWGDVWSEMETRIIVSNVIWPKYCKKWFAFFYVKFKVILFLIFCLI